MSDQEFCLGLVTINVPKGQYLLEVEFKNTPVRTIGNILSIVSIFGMFFFLIKKDEKISKK